MGTKRMIAVTGLIAAIVALTGCASGAQGPPAANADGSTSALAEQMRAEIAPLLERPTHLGISTPLHGMPAHKELIFMQCAFPACKVLADATEQAATEVGWTVRRINTGSTPEEIKAAWAQAAQQSPDGIIAVTHERSYFNHELLDIQKQGIPVLRMNVVDEPGAGVTANLLDSKTYIRAGQIMADYALAQHGEKLNTLAVTAGATIPSLQLIAKSYTTTIKEKCASCVVETLEMPSSAVGGDLSQRLSSHLRSKPDINFVEIGVSDLMIGVPAALESAGISKDAVQFMSLGASNEAANQYLMDANYLTAMVTSASQDTSWRAIDFFARAFNGQDYSDTVNAEKVPTWIVTPKTVPSAKMFPTVKDFDAQFRALWGIS